MPKESALPRVVIAADDANGRSRIARDEPAHAVRTVAERPGYRVSNVWATFGAPAPIGDRLPLLSLKSLAPVHSISVS